MNFLVTLLALLMSAVQGTTATVQTIWSVVKSQSQKLTEQTNVLSQLTTTVQNNYNDLSQRLAQFGTAIGLQINQLSAGFKVWTDEATLEFNRITTRFNEEHTLLTNNVVRLDGRIDNIQLAVATGMKGFLVLSGLEAGSKGSIDKAKFNKGSGQYIVNVEMLRDNEGNLPSNEPYTLVSSTNQEMPIKENENLIVEFDEAAGTYTFVTKDSNSIGRVEGDLKALISDVRRFATDAKPYYEKQAADMKLIRDEAQAVLGAAIEPIVAPEPIPMQMPVAPEPIPMQMPVAPEPQRMFKLSPGQLVTIPDFANKNVKILSDPSGIVDGIAIWGKVEERLNDRVMYSYDKELILYNYGMPYDIFVTVAYEA